MNLITQKHLPRRTFLKGVGATLALPMLDAMIPATARGAQRSAGLAPNRLAFAYIPNGATMAEWTPAGEGGAFTFSRILKPFEAYRQDLTVVSGLSHAQPRRAREQTAAPDAPPPPGNQRPREIPPNNNDDEELIPGQPGGHATAGSLYLTGVRPKKTIGMDVQAGTSVDQIVAAALNGKTRLPSLELSCDDTRSVGNCDGGYSCVYNNTICWRNPNSPLPPETNPRMVFERLFGTEDFGLDPQVRARRVQYRSSILDLVGERARSLMGTLGTSDRRKVDEYLHGVREIEKRIQAAERDANQATPGIDKPAGIPVQFADHLRLMFDLQVMAWQGDVTRVMTLMIGREGSLRTYPEIGVPDSHHPLTHHRNNPTFIEKVTQINCYHAQLFTYFIDKLKRTPDGDGSLLDHAMVVYGSGISDGDSHDHSNLPTVVFGHGNGRLKTGRHLAYAGGTRMNRLYLTLMECMGVPQENFSGTTEALGEIVT
jgi:hypothetical protein